MRRVGYVILGSLALSCAPMSRESRNSPSSAEARRASGVARVTPFSESYFGVRVADPYRWMEDPSSTEFRRWTEGQAAATRTTLGRVPGRAQLFTELRALMQDESSIDDVRMAGGSYFVIRRDPGQQTGALWIRNSTGAESALLEPALSTAGQEAIDYFSPSTDGAFVAVGVSEGGSQKTRLSVIDARSRRVVDGPIERTRYAGISWCTGECGSEKGAFVYSRHPPLAPGTPDDAIYDWAQVYLHVVGAPPANDPVVFSTTPAPGIRLNSDDLPSVTLTAGCPYAIATITHGVANEISLYTKPANKLTTAEVPWVRIATPDDRVVEYGVERDRIFMRTHRDAPRYKIVRAKLTDRGVEEARVIVPEGDRTLDSLTVSGSHLYATAMLLGARTLRIYDGDGHLREAPRAPYATQIKSISSDQRGGVVFQEQGHGHSPMWSTLDGEARVTPLPFNPPPRTIEGIEERVEYATSSDGTKIPMTIVARRGTRFDGTSPTWLIGYGAGGTSLPPTFVPARKAWYDRGGIVVSAHIRGGGELGAAWHEAALREKKVRAIEDFVACAERLVALRYTSPATLGVYGRSAGGIVVGGAIVRRPDLFRAVISDVGVSNALRGEVMPEGIENTKEFGTFKDEVGFRGLLEQDAYLAVRDHTRYPAALLTAAQNDSGVMAWQAGKMVARLQAASTSGRPVLLRYGYGEGHNIWTSDQQVDRFADFFSFFLWQFGVKGFQPE